MTHFIMKTQTLRTFQVMYTYQAILSSEVKTLSGIMVLTADELTAHLGITLLKEPETVDLTFDFMHQLKYVAFETISTFFLHYLNNLVKMTINLLSFIPLISNSKKLLYLETSLKYFLTQSLASITFLFIVLIKFSL